MDLPGIGQLRGLDNIPHKTGLCTVLGANYTGDRRKRECRGLSNLTLQTTLQGAPLKLRLGGVFANANSLAGVEGN